ncbi:MAG: hypothetical protein PHO63_01495 [Bacilli bacterium]|nr:hypothetical protein [Bacilli bacterium]MDD4809499.1 hypothetical protein [Bacilli bacterium]
MDDFITNTLSMVIIGDEESHAFDGQIKMNGRKEGFFYHRDSINQIVNELITEGYSLSDINLENSNESGFDLITMGHILFCNCTMENYCFGYLFLPRRLTAKQIESLRSLEPHFQKFPELYLMRVDKENQECFETEVTKDEFNVDNLLHTHYPIENKRK